MSLTNGSLIVFEGVDSVGKTTLCHALADVLRKRGRKITLLSFPGRAEGTLGALIYRVHHEPEAFGISRMAPASLQALHLAAHLDTIETTILPLLENGETIILDRYWWSMWAYGLAGGADNGLLDALVEVERRAWLIVHPSVLFYVTRSMPFHATSGSNWREVQNAYEILLQREAGRYPIQRVENEGTMNLAVEMILRHIEI